MGICSGTCTSNARLDGKTAIITGANTGIGYHTAKDFYKRGARVILACRNLQKAHKAARQIINECTDVRNVGVLSTIELDLTNLNAVRLCATKILEKEQQINLLINNAGVMMHPKAYTVDGNEMHIATNHLGHFLFTLLLMPKMCQSAPARIVNVASVAHELGERMNLDDLNWQKRDYSPANAYQQSKLANILFSKELAPRLDRAGIKGVTSYSLHPGVIDTELSRHLENGLDILWYYYVKYLGKTAEEGAQTQIYCAVDEECENQSGKYYSDCSPKKPAKNARNNEDARRLWEESVRLVDLEGYNPFQTSP